MSALKLKLYNALINRVPAIQKRYQRSRSRNTGRRKILSWGYLIWLNFQYYFIPSSDLRRDNGSEPDQYKSVIAGSESEQDDHENPELLEEKLRSADIISFDVFDTLILRKMSRPEDVFYLLEKKLAYPGIRLLRMQAEQKCRQQRFAAARDYEVTIEEIWEQLSRATGIDPADGIAAEFEAEKDVCMANPYFLGMVWNLKRAGRKLIVCSDMYLGASRIKKLLDLCGYPAFDAYYISCDWRKSKADGQLYDVLRKEVGTDKTVIHVGDNEFSDGSQAVSRGLRSVLYRNVQSAGLRYRAEDMDPIMASVYAGIIDSYLHCGLHHESWEFEFGFIYGGLLVTGYCQFIHDFAESRQIDKILFFSRDGEIIDKVYQFLYPEQKEKCSYVYWSRLASTKMSARLLRSHYLERMVLHKVNQQYSLEEIFHTMETDDMLPAFLYEYRQRKYSEKSELSDKAAEDVIEFCINHWDELCRHYDPELEEGKRYFQEILQGSKQVIAVDAGWVGSGALTFSRICKEIWNFDCNIYGLLAGTCAANNMDYDSTAMELAEGRLVSYLFSALDNRDLWKKHDAAKGHNMLVELLLSSEQTSFRGFIPGEDHKYSFNTEKESINAGEIQRGIMKFAQLYKEHPLGYLNITGRDAAAPIALLYNNPPYIDQLISTSKIKANIE